MAMYTVCLSRQYWNDSIRSEVKCISVPSHCFMTWALSGYPVYFEGFKSQSVRHVLSQIERAFQCRLVSPCATAVKPDYNEI
jgi:hypothetical protein